MEEWLSDRKQRVVLNVEVSDWGEILSGVVQGSVLGPILFLCYINDLDLAVDMVMGIGGEERQTILKKFTDDTKWGEVVESGQDRANFQTGLDNLQKWADTWQMSYNVSKCHIMHFGKNNRKYKYQLGGIELEATEWEKDVGVIVSNDLKPSLQCSKAAAKANQVLGQISRGVTYRDKETFLRLYKTYVRPHLQYCQAAWAPWLEADKKLLEKVQERAIRMISNLRGRCYQDRLKEVGMTTLEERRRRGDMIATYRILTGKDRVSPDQWFHMARETGTRQSKGYLSVEEPVLGKLEFRRSQFSQRVSGNWNSLPDWVRRASTVNSFKNNLDSHWYGD